MKDVPLKPQYPLQNLHYELILPLTETSGNVTNYNSALVH